MEGVRIDGDTAVVVARYSWGAWLAFLALAVGFHSGAYHDRRNVWVDDDGWSYEIDEDDAPAIEKAIPREAV